MPKDKELEIFISKYKSTKYLVETEEQKKLMQQLIESFNIEPATIAFFGTYVNNSIVIFTQYT